jgi:predicted Na+-dependent transporter
MELLSNFFIFIIVILSTFTFLSPFIFIFLPYLSYLLAMVILLMGLTLNKDEIIAVIKIGK